MGDEKRSNDSSAQTYSRDMTHAHERKPTPAVIKPLIMTTNRTLITSCSTQTWSLTRLLMHDGVHAQYAKGPLHHAHRCLVLHCQLRAQGPLLER